MTTTIPQREKIMIDEGMEQLLLYLNKDERLSATAMEFPIEKDAYGWRIASHGRTASVVQETYGPDMLISKTTIEDITLEKLFIEGNTVYAGYGPVTKSLVVGKPEQVIEPAQRMDGDPADNEFFPGVKG